MDQHFRGLWEVHNRLWHEWYAMWHDDDASGLKPSYEEWLEQRLEAAERVVIAYNKCVPALGRELDDARNELDAALVGWAALTREEKHDD